MEGRGSGREAGITSQKKGRKEERGEREWPGSAPSLPQAWLTEIHEYAQRDVVIMLLGNKVSATCWASPSTASAPPRHPKSVCCFSNKGVPDHTSRRLQPSHWCTCPALPRPPAEPSHCLKVRKGSPQGDWCNRARHLPCIWSAQVLSLASHRSQPCAGNQVD